MKRVLLIEDDETMRVLLKTLLEIEGFQVKLWDLASNLLQTVSEFLPDIILLDVRLHKLSGFDILQKIRQEDMLKQPKIIMSSGIDFRHQSKNNGADKFIQKPYMPEDLIKSIRELIKE